MRILATAIQRSEAIRGSVVAGFGLAVLLAAAPAFGAPTPTTAPQTVHVNPRKIWTSTGIVLHKGDTATITAAGRMHFGTDDIAALSPEGIPRSKCAVASGAQGTRARPWPAQNLDCWSLIGKIGASPAFEIGRARTVRVVAPGALLVGVNDNYLRDNANGWTVTVRVTPSPAPPASASAESKSSGSGLVLVLAGLAALLVLLVLLLLWRRSRKGEPKAAQPVPAPAKSTPAAAPLLGAEEPPAVLLQAQSEGELSAGNIVAVSFGDPHSLHVGYNHFPESTTVHLRIVQGTTRLTSEFVTNGREATPQIAIVPLDDGLDPAGDAADVTFAWAVGGVPFNYAVRRKPDVEAGA